MSEKWTREQAIIVFNLYCQIPFQKASSTNPQIVKIAELIGRSPNSVKMKIGNYGSLDPELQKRGIVGLGNISKLDKEIWEEFNNNWEKLAYESELIKAKLSNINIEQTIIDVDNYFPEGKDKESFVKTRINQQFFRKTILSANNYRCCITGIQIPELLVASHIIPWKDKKETRLDPRNGLCLNAFHDKAFDKGLITISDSFRIIVSESITNKYSKNTSLDWFKSYDRKKMIMPEKFAPLQKYLEYHRKNIFIS